MEDLGRRGGEAGLPHAVDAEGAVARLLFHEAENLDKCRAGKAGRVCHFLPRNECVPLSRVPFS